MHHAHPGTISTPVDPHDPRTADAGAPFMNARELAAFLGVSPSTIARRKRDGMLPHLRIGRRVLFDPVAVRAALNQSTPRAEVRP